MPTYVYECKSCEFQFENFEKNMLGRRLEICPQPLCGGELKLIPQGAAFQFKGQGWFNRQMSHKVIKPSGNK